ncbi:unnamed protein product [Blepharisma stoltei]|uniref:Adenylate kinase n=1 Tax=Blepharisma stoltei TaxID=1481888 RepID=A0AAU9JI22_9CILI|nr:unnamed protein product [Blepharisma stoltei]
MLHYKLKFHLYLISVMDLKQKLEYQQGVEEYLESNDVYELFEYLLKELLIDKPDDPIDFLIHKLENPRRRRLFLTGGIGSSRRMVARDLASRFRVESVNVYDLLKNEVKKAGKHAEGVLTAWRQGTYVPDELVLDILMPVLEGLEKQGKSYILNGCPRTRVQSLALQRAGIIPDRIAILTADENAYKEKFRQNFIESQEVKPLDDSVADEASQRALEELTYNLNGVKDVYENQWHEIDAAGPVDKIADRVAKIFLMKGRSNAPRRPPKVILLGPPGSGRSSQAQNLAVRYGLSLVSTSQLLRDQINRKSEIGKNIAAIMSTGDMVPDFIITELVRNRLQETDCKMNGWVLDGFPKTVEQIRSLKEFKIQPSHVFFLESSDALVYERIEQRRLDPVSGKFYSVTSLPEDQGLRDRLVTLEEDSHEAVRKRLQNYKEHSTKLHAEFAKVGMNIKAELDENLITEMIGDAIENSIPHEFD